MYVRRASFVLAVALAAFAPAARAAPPASGSGGTSQWAVLLGIEDLSSTSGVSLRGDLVIPLQALSPSVGFAIVPSIGYSHFSNDYNDPFASVAGVSVNESLNLFRGMAAARFTFGHHPTFHPYADAGLGLYVSSYSYDYRDSFYGTMSSNSTTDFGFVMRFAGGINIQVSPSFALGAELGFQPYVGDGPDSTSTNLLFSAAFRM